MPKIEQKQVVIDEIKEKLNRAVSVVLVDGRGLTVEEDTKLRKKLRESGVDYKVYKNSMVNFAIENTEYKDLAPFLKGPTTVAFSYTEATLAAGLISKELKALPNLEFKAGVIDGVTYDAAGIDVIAKIPSKEELLSKLLGSFKAPMSSFARVINAIAEKNGDGSETPATVAEAPVSEPEPVVEETVSEAVTEEPTEA